MNNIQGLVTELKQLNVEIKRLSKKTSELRKQSKAVESQIVEYLKHKEQPGLKYNDTAIILETKSARTTKKKADMETDAIEILERHGIDNADSVLKEILDARKGDEIEKQKIKLKPIKKF